MSDTSICGDESWTAIGEAARRQLRRHQEAAAASHLHAPPPATAALTLIDQPSASSAAAADAPPPSLHSPRSTNAEARRQALTAANADTLHWLSASTSPPSQSVESPSPHKHQPQLRIETRLAEEAMKKLNSAKLSAGNEAAALEKPSSSLNAPEQKLGEPKTEDLNIYS